MNVRNVLKTYSLLRTLSDDETALLNTLRAMSDTERAMTVEAFGGSMGKPGKGVSSTKSKKLQKCDVCGVSKRAAHHKDTSHKDYHEFDARKAGGAGKSARASSLQRQIQSSAKGRPVSVDGDDAKFDTDDPSDLPRPCAECSQFADANIHHLTSGPNYHPFVSPPSAPVADGRSSSRNGSPGTSVASLSDETESVSGVAGG